ncbi:ATP-dependent zinc protease [Gammaproteobacteria bacterium]|nr:ATP-dependent zinc protease [Gammaproteobacteria bacterium]
MNQILGWKEWVELPQLGIPSIKAKIDTGAKTSSLHAENIESFSKDGGVYVRFSTNFGIENSKSITCECPVIDKRIVVSSSGQGELRYAILTKIRLGKWSGDVEMTLTSRKKMQYNMLVGRTSIRAGNFLVDPSKKYILGK